MSFTAEVKDELSRVPATCTPVSYTHLDVYKRQGQGETAACPHAPVRELPGRPRQDTAAGRPDRQLRLHRGDVYKRQASRTAPAMWSKTHGAIRLRCSPCRSRLTRTTRAASRAPGSPKPMPAHSPTRSCIGWPSTRTPAIAAWACSCSTAPSASHAPATARRCAPTCTSATFPCRGCWRSTATSLSLIHI